MLSEACSPLSTPRNSIRGGDADDDDALAHHHDDDDRDGDLQLRVDESIVAEG